MPESFHKPRVLPLAWLVAALIAMFCLDRWFPVFSLVQAPYNWSGLGLTIPGLAITLHSGIAFLKVKTGLLPFSEASQLVTDGLYRYSRNPMYLGMAAFLFGLAILYGSLSVVVPAFLFVWIIDRQFIRNEELFLLDTFGSDYREYLESVRRWI